MPIDFPNSPATNDFYTTAGKTWQWNGTSWSLVSIAMNVDVNTINTESDGAVSIMEVGP